MAKVLIQKIGKDGKPGAPKLVEGDFSAELKPGGEYIVTPVISVPAADDLQADEGNEPENA